MLADAAAASARSAAERVLAVLTQNRAELPKEILNVSG
jgi:hypothetical protein